jgi:hypothetical protein
VYFAGCVDECDGQSVQSFVVEVEGTGETVVRSSESSGGFMTVAIEENMRSDREAEKEKQTMGLTHGYPMSTSLSTHLPYYCGVG